MTIIHFREGTLELSSTYCYSTAADAIRAAARNLGQTVRASKGWVESSCSGPSWAHTHNEVGHSCEARITGDFSEERLQHLFEHGWWNYMTEDQEHPNVKFQKSSCYGGRSFVEVID